MTLSMTISEAKELQKADLDVSDEAVAQAEQEAAEAAALVAALERQVTDGPKPPTPAAMTEARTLAEFAARRMKRTRERADQAKAARRLLDLEAVGKEVEAIHAGASQPDAGIIAAVKQVADGCAALRQLAEAHNGKVRAVVSRALELAAEPAAPNGPLASSAHVAVAAGQRKIQSGNAAVQMVAPATVDDAVALAVKGDADGAIRRLSAAHTVAPLQPHDRYYLGGGGTVIGQDDNSPSAREMARQAATGEVRELSPEEVGAFLAGRFHGHVKGA